MTQITSIKEKPLAELYDAIARNKSNPSGIMTAMLEALDEVMNGTVGFFDPTNPTVMLLESSAVAVAAAVNENVSLLRHRYSSLAETQEELYNHMSDWDFANRFASPGVVPIGFLFGLNTMLTEMVMDEEEKCKKAVIPRDTEVVIGNITFTLQYPIVIRYYNTGTLAVSYDAEIVSPFQSLETNIIPYEQRAMPDGTRFIYFQVPLHQLKIDMITNTIQAGRVFKMQTSFTDQFFYARAFIRNSGTGNNWLEIKTTHSDLVFDRRNPTIVLKVDSDTITATLPLIYTTTGSLLGDVKLHVYTTKGGLVENLENYDTAIELRALDPDKDLSVYTTDSLNIVPRQAITTATLSGGTNGLSFEKLRERVIFNSVGPQILPITTVQIQTAVENQGFDIIKNVDMVTDRIFLATQNLPKPSNTRLLTSANIGIETFVVDKETLENHPYVYVNGDRWTLTPKNLFKQDNGILSMLSLKKIQELQLLEETVKVTRLNTSKYLFTPFHWVFDNTKSDFALRPYYLDKPTISTINFVRQNQTLELAVNTAARWITRTTYGYKVSIRVLSGNFYKALPNSQVSAQLMLYPQGETIPVYIKGYLSNVSDAEEREFSFDINTNYDIDDTNRLLVLNVGLDSQNQQNVWIDLNTEVHIFLCTTSKTIEYKKDASNGLFGEFQLPQGSVPITHETVKLTLGHPLKNLWSRARNLTVGYDYQTYTESVQLTYPKDVYKTDPVTGRIFTKDAKGKPVFTIEHKFGDLVFGFNNEPVWKYRKGDVIIDHKTGAPLLKPTSLVKKEVDLLFIDGRHYFVNDKAYTEYNQELIDLLVTWVTDDLASIQNKLLDQTHIFYHPKSQIGQCVVDKGDGVTLIIDSEQSPVVDLYVPSNVYMSENLRLQLTNKTIKLLDSALSLTELNNSNVEAALREAYGGAVTSMKLSNLGGGHNLHYAKVVSPDQRLSLKRILDIQSDGTLIMKEDVKINFFKT